MKPGNLVVSIVLTNMILFYACMNDNPKTKISEPKAADTTVAFKAEIKPGASADSINKPHNDLARFIAGLQPLDHTLPEGFTKDSSWISYAQLMNKKWNKLNDGHFKKIQEFREQELSDINQSHPVIFYPFSGPDFLNATQFFPEAGAYIMLALEPPGSLPHPDKLPVDSLSGYLQQVNNSLYAILNFSFFRTISMAGDFKADELNGSIHLLCVFLQRTNHSIVDITKIAIDTLGNIIPFSQFNGKCNLQGLQIRCFRNEDGMIKTINYFSVDISDQALAKNVCMQQYLKKLPEVTTYVKSASYLMHKPYFSTVRNTILEKSNHVLQDDSGIPIRYFNENKWSRQLYGTYDKPIRLFANMFQADLKQLYDSTGNEKVKPLHFGIGYDYKENQSNLMLFRKK